MREGHAPRPLFSSRLKSQHYGFHRHPSLKTFPSGRWLHCLGLAFWYPLRVFTCPSPPFGFLVVILVAPLVHGRFVSPFPRTSRRVSLSDLHGRKACSLRSRLALRCRTHGRSRPRLAWLVPLMGKASVSNISVSPCPPVIRKALDMACLLAVASGFAILPPSSSCSILWHSYSHPTILGWHPLCPVAPLTRPPPSAPRDLLYGRTSP